MCNITSLICNIIQVECLPNKFILTMNSIRKINELPNKSFFNTSSNKKDTGCQDMWCEVIPLISCHVIFDSIRNFVKYFFLLMYNVFEIIRCLWQNLKLVNLWGTLQLSPDKLISEINKIWIYIFKQNYEKLFDELRLASNQKKQLLK